MPCNERICFSASLSAGRPAFGCRRYSEENALSDLKFGLHDFDAVRHTRAETFLGPREIFIGKLDILTRDFDLLLCSLQIKKCGADAVIDLGSASIFTLVITIPQVLNIWVGRRAAGVSLVWWSAYLVSALLWLWHGIRQRDRNIYLPCIGWIALDSAVILGVIIYR